MVRDNTLGDRIKHLRRRRGLTQRELAFKVNTTPTTISNYEVGYSKPSYDMICAIARVLDIEESYFNKDNDFEAKMYQSAYANIKIYYFNIKNIQGLISADPHLCDGCLMLPYTNEFNGQKVFATQLTDNSMAKSNLSTGSCVIINSSLPFKNNSIVLVYIKPENRITVRYAVIDDGTITLTDSSYLSKSEILQYYLNDVIIIGTVTKAVIDIDKR